MAYDFGLGRADNGDVKAIVNNRDNTRTQYFSYDALNRIALANTQAASGANAWGQAFGYDPWGNLTSTTVIQGSAPSLSVSVNANNQITGAPFSYDAAGNLLPDALNTYIWNAEGKMATVSSAQGAVTYAYDGDGKRVEKSNGKLYWYGVDANVLAESDAAGNITDEYIFFGGGRLARVDANGNILDDCDFMPFGNEQCVASSSGNNYKFTGKEQDTESGNDYFSARYYSSQYNRFASPDPENAGADSSNPQSWNMYAYAGNNPTTNTDPDGLDCLYLTSQSTNSIDVGVESGFCGQQGGIYVNGTVDANSFTYSGTELGYSFTPYSGGNGTGVIAFSGPGNTPTGDEQSLETLSIAGQMASAEITSFLKGTGVAATAQVGGGFLGAALEATSAAGEIGSAVAEENGIATGANSDYIDVTKPGSRLPNRFTNVTAQEFGQNLEATGFKKSIQGDVTVYAKGDTQYTVYPVSKSTGAPTAQVSVGGRPVAKIRLQQ